MDMWSAFWGLVSDITLYSQWVLTDLLIMPACSWRADQQPCCWVTYCAFRCCLPRCNERKIGTLDVQLTSILAAVLKFFALHKLSLFMHDFIFTRWRWLSISYQERNWYFSHVTVEFTLLSVFASFFLSHCSRYYYPVTFCSLYLGYWRLNLRLHSR